LGLNILGIVEDRLLYYYSSKLCSLSISGIMYPDIVTRCLIKMCGYNIGGNVMSRFNNSRIRFRSQVGVRDVVIF